MDSRFAAIADALEADWHGKARPEQLPPPGDWFVWLILSGRGWGKTRTGAEWVLEQVRRGVRRLALIGATTGDVRQVMLSGPSGLLTVASGRDLPEYEPSNRWLLWPNGAVAYLYSAEEPNRLRGPQFEAVWADELAAWQDPEAVWDQLGYGLRVGSPKVVITTTPRPLPIIKRLVKTEGVVVTRGSTFDNVANLSDAYFRNVIAPKVGTRNGRQEIEGEILEDTPGALWSHAMIDGTRRLPGSVPSMRRIVVAIDPAVTVGESSDETGIVVAGLGEDDHGYVLEDASGKFAPIEWAKRAVALYHRHHADRIVAEVNQGGDLVEATIRTVDPLVPFRGVHASRGKLVRAEPVSALYEQRRVHHVGAFPKLEDQMAGFEPGSRKSPDRLDAMVWALTDLLLGRQAAGALFAFLRQEAAIERGEMTRPMATPAAPAVVRLIVPPGHSTVILISGASVTPDRHGVIACQPEDAQPLKALGWAEAAPACAHEEMQR